MSYRPEVQVDGKWHSNALRFATEAEAAASARDLFSRWTLTTGHRAAPSDDPVNYRWDNESGLVAVAPESAGSAVQS